MKIKLKIQLINYFFYPSKFFKKFHFFMTLNLKCVTLILQMNEYNLMYYCFGFARHSQWKSIGKERDYLLTLYCINYAVGIVR